MDQQPAFGFQQLVTQIIGEMAKALAERVGETREQQFVRLQAAVNGIMAFLPRDAIEAMLAGRVLLFHEMLVDTISDSLRGKVNAARAPIRGGIVALDRAFGQNFKRLMDYQKRQDQGRRDEPRAEPAAPADVPHEAEIATQTPVPAPRPAPTEAPMAPLLNRAARRAAKKQAYAEQRAARTQANAVQTRDTAAPVNTRRPEAVAVFSGRPKGDYVPSEKEIAAVCANPLAMAALGACDAAAFARALGADEPNEDFLAAATQPGSPFDKNTWSKRRAEESVAEAESSSVA